MSDTAIVVRDLVEAALKGAPGGSEDAQFEEFQALLLRHPDCQQVVNRRFFAGALRMQRAGSGTARVTNSMAHRKTLDTQASAIAQIVRKVVLMDHLLSDGVTRLGDATREQLGKEVGWMSKIVQRLRPGQRVRDILTEKDLMGLLVERDTRPVGPALQSMPGARRTEMPPRTVWMKLGDVQPKTSAELTASLMGDPAPGRSALDQRSS